ncbi:MAG: endolytic transglycosylase MltG [Myxococcales bacterium]|nr:endolytic transglycosylase MltG [Myxococcales bacterium]
MLRPSTTFLAVLGSFLLACAGLGATPAHGEPFVLEVPKGATPSSIAPRVAEAGFVSWPWQWKLYVRTTDASCLKAGRFQVEPDMSLSELLTTLCGPPLANDVPFTVLEGWRIADTDAALAKEGWITAGGYAAVARGKTVEAPFPVEGATYEGYLWPETYLINPDAFDAQAFVSRQLTTFQERFQQPHGGQLGGRSLHEIVVMGSMIEQEERDPDNRPLISGILWNRIDQGIPLGVDATSRYTLEDWDDDVMPKIRDRSDPYNSRVHRGLPPTAIGAPSLSALQAAMQPKKTPYLFYLHDRTCTLRTATTNAGHEQNKRRHGICE